MFILILLAVFAAIIGYLAQVTGLCMVRGVSDWLGGKKVRLMAILGSGFWVYLYLPIATKDSLFLNNSKLHLSFLLGGLIFGLGASANGACSISTATRLSSGDLKMVFTMFGWLVGWLLWEFINVATPYQEMAPYSETFSWFVVLGLTAASIWVYIKRRQDWKIWSGIMLVGFLAGALFLIQPAWSPSDFVKDLGLAILRKNPQNLPALDRIIILVVMLLGMSFGAQRYHLFKWEIPSLRGIVKHLASGIFMGLGAAISLGGNDFQLLLALPAQSPAGILAIAGMLLGIRIGLLFAAEK